MRIYITFFCYVILFEGCSSLILNKEVAQKERISERKLSCEEKAKPKSLQYLEQQYRCTSHPEEQ